MERKKEKVLTKAQTMAKQKKLHFMLRTAIRTLFFLLMPGAFAACLNGIKQIFRSIAAGAVIQPDGFIAVLLFFTVFTMVFGRLFCGYFCAFGSLGDFVYWLSGIVQKRVFKRKKQLTISDRYAVLLSKLKLLNLAFIIIACAFSFDSALTGTSPFDVFSMITSFNFKLGGYTAGIIAFVTVLLLMAFCERGFCRFLCPIGAFFTLLPVFPFGILKRDSANCIKGCDICKRNCPVNIKLENDSVMNGECICCERCMFGCPKSNICHSEKRLLDSKIIPLLLKTAVFFIAAALLGLCRLF